MTWPIADVSRNKSVRPASIEKSMETSGDTSAPSMAAVDDARSPIRAPAPVRPALGARAGLAVVALYTITMFVSAGLLFLVQPLFARMVLPRMGGSPAVWNTAVVFYQVVLLAGYIYAHAATRWLTVRQQILIHAVLVMTPLLVLPIGVPSGWEPPSSGSPIPALLGLLSVAVGLPFFVVSTTSPLLQSWFSRTGHRAAADPYFLYAASNVGSMLGLLSYPLLLEPRLRLTEQSWFWAGGYLVLVVLVLGSAAVAWRTHARAGPTAAEVAIPAHSDASALTLRRRARWILLAFVPSSLMLSVTTYLSTTIAPLPLLWVIPLSLYLLTFILVFSKREVLSQRVLRRALPIAVLPLLVVTMTPGLSSALLLPLHLLFFFVAAMVCHGALAADRPGPRLLTEFYLWISVGGALGGAFTALLAPLWFNNVQEYPLTLALLCAVAPAGAAAALGRLSARRLDFLLPIVVTTLAGALLLGVTAAGPDTTVAWVAALTVLMLVTYGFSRRPLRYGLAIGGVVLAGLILPSDQQNRLRTDRNFFGVKEVRLDSERQLIYLIHGGVVHGAQSLDPERRRDPLTYYTKSGPLGDIFERMRERHENLRVGALGLGAGSAACFAAPGDRWTFYEIDPQVVRIARDPRYFSYLSDCTPNAEVVLGDARLSMQRAPGADYDLLILDAYSSDAIPVHLVTREAVRLYLDQLAPGGMLAFHISNQYFDLEGVLAELAADAGMVAVIREDLAVLPADEDAGKSPSAWVAMSRSRENLQGLSNATSWRPARGEAGTKVWTDDHSSLLSVLRTPW